MKHILLASLALGLLAAVAAPAPPRDEQSEKDKKALQGTWKVISSEADGEESPAENNEKLRLIFDGNMIRLIGVSDDPNEEHSATFTLDATKSPRQIDATLTSGEDKGSVAEGIYKIEDGTVTMCWGHPGTDRPTEFKTSEGSQSRMFVMKKAE